MGDQGDPESVPDTEQCCKRSRLKDTWVLVKDFLKDQGLEKLHIDSYNHFINVEMPKILEAHRRVTSDADANWYVLIT